MNLGPAIACVTKRDTKRVQRGKRLCAWVAARPAGGTPGEKRQASRVSMGNMEGGLGKTFPSRPSQPLELLLLLLLQPLLFLRAVANALSFRHVNTEKGHGTFPMQSANRLPDAEKNATREWGVFWISHSIVLRAMRNDIAGWRDEIRSRTFQILENSVDEENHLRPLLLLPALWLMSLPQ